MIYGILSALPMLVCLFWTLSLAMESRRGSKAGHVLTLWMGTAAALYACHWVYFNREYAMIPATDTLYALCTLSVYPLYYLYIRRLTGSDAPGLRDYCTLIPAVLSFVSCAVIYAMMEEGERAVYICEVMYGQETEAELSIWGRAQMVRSRLAGLANGALIVYVLWQGGRRIARYNREIENYYSDTEGKTFSEIRTLLVFFVATSLSSFVMHAIGRDHFADSAWLILIPSMLFSILLYALGYIGYRQRFTIEDFARDERRADEAEISLLGEPVSAQESAQGREALKARLLSLLEHDGMFKDPNLKITDMAVRMGSNRAYVSRIVNQDLNTSFSELINTYRVEHAKRLLQQSRPSPVTIAEVVEQSGFSSESSFYRIFRHSTGMSPKAWRGKYGAGEPLRK